MKKITLIDPPAPVGGFNTGLAYLAGALKKEKHKVFVLDLVNNSSNIDFRLKKAVQDTDYVGLSIKSFTVDSSLKIAKKIKKYNKNAYIIAGGPHITLDGEKFMKKNMIFNYSFIGDSEIPLTQLLNNEKPEKIPSLIYRKKGKVVMGENPNVKRDINNLPLPDFSKFDTNKILKTYNIITSRGCPYNCTYCSVPLIYNRRWRARSVDKLIQELRKVSKKYNHFSVLDDNFTLDKKRAKEFCRKYMKSGIKMKWSCPNGIRADCLDDELAKLMKKSGCQRVALGIETMDEKLFESIKKGEKVSDIVNAIKLLKKNKIGVTGFFIIGLPESTYKKDLETVKKLKKLDISTVGNILVPFPGTEAGDLIFKSRKYKVIDDWKRAVTFGDVPIVVFESEQYTKRQLEKMYYLANLRLKNYHLFVNNEKSFLSNSFFLLRKILRNDLFYSSIHFFNIFKILHGKRRFV